MATTPKHVEAKKQEEHVDCRTVHLLVLPEFQYVIMHGMNNVKLGFVILLFSLLAG